MSVQSPFRRSRYFLSGALVAGAVAVAGCEIAQTDGAQGASGVDAGVAATEFQVDPFFPQELPNNWVIGQVSGLTVDSRDHVWIVQRPGSISAQEAGSSQDPPISMCCDPAPPVLEFDTEGNLVQAWGGPGDGYDWPNSEHGIHVDHQDNVWIGSGDGADGNHILKFTRDGEFLLQIGEPGVSEGSNDTEHLAGPAAIEVDPVDHEVYVADGYHNRRLIVFDAETGEYRRHWGAYGEAPHDEPLGPYDPDAEPAQGFRGPVHGLAISDDGLVYVADRRSNRMQIFQKDGTYVDEMLIRPETLSMGSVWDMALSTDPDQSLIYVPDGVNNTVWMVDRESLEIVGNFARGGRWAGELGWAHNVAVDSRGNVYVSEVENSKRFQKFARQN